MKFKSQKIIPKIWKNQKLYLKKIKNNFKNNFKKIFKTKKSNQQLSLKYSNFQNKFSSKIIYL